MNILELVRENIINLTPYSSARHEFEGEASTFLDANENPFDNNLNRYPDPFQKEIKNKLSTLKNVEASNIFLGNGSDEVIDLLIRVFCEPNKDSIVISSPTYAMYSVSANINAVNVIDIPLSKNFNLDVENLINTNAKICFICSPNNPTGNAFKISDIEKLIQNFKGIVVVDEAYIDFSKEKTAVELLGKYHNLVVMQTLSKAWGLAATRCGIAITSKEIIKYLNLVKPPYNMGTPNQEAILNALNHYQEFLSQKQALLIERNKMFTFLQQFSFIETVFETEANFILIKVNDAIKLYKYLTGNGIVVRNRSNQLHCDNCLRVTIGTENENIFLIEKLKNFN